MGRAAGSLRKARKVLVEALESRLLMSRVLGIDVSAWQGTIDWPAVKAAGKDFALVRSTRGGTTGTYNQSTREGTLSHRYDDPYFASNMQNARLAGLLVGAYHFARPDIPTNTGADEALHFLEMAGDYMGTGYLPPVLDLEAGAAVRTPDELSAFAVEFGQTIFDAKGVWPTVYASSSYASDPATSGNAGGYIRPVVAEKMPNLWIARWPNQSNPGAIDVQNINPPAAAGYPNVYGVWNPTYPVIPDPHPWKIWQYASTGKVPGIGGGTANVDLDVFNGDHADIGDFTIDGPAMMTVIRNYAALANNLGTPFDLGTVLKGATVPPTFTFRVQNDGGSQLDLSGLAVPDGYTVIDGLVGSLLPGQSDAVTVRLDSAVVGTKAGNISFASTDATNPFFNIPVTGVVVPVPGNLRGVVYHDLNGNGRRDAKDPGLKGQSVFVDLNNNGIRDGGLMSTDVPKGIPDANPIGVSSTLLVSGLPTITQVSVTFNITHTWTSDLTGYLIAPDGTTVTLFQRVGGSGDNFIDTTLDDAATTSIGAGAAPFSGTYRPSPDSLSTLIGLDPNGTWAFKVVDEWSRDVGTINYWSLKLDSVQPEPIATTDATGQYLFTGLTPGPATLRLMVPGGWYQTMPTTPSATVQVASNQTLWGQHFGLARFGSVSGRAFVDANANKRLDKTEIGLQGATVFLDTNNNGVLDAGEQSAITDSLGNWTLGSVRVGTYNVRFIPGGARVATTPTFSSVTITSGSSVVGKLFGAR